MHDAEKSRHLILDGEWAARMCEPGAGETAGWERGEFEAELAATVPGQLQRDLVRAGLEPDYNIGENAPAFRAREGKDWWLRRDFELDRTSERTELCFGGIDTEADVWLNGVHLGHHGNAHVGWTLDATRAVRPGRNRLVVRLDDGTRQAAGRELERYSGLSEEMTAAGEPRMWVRKPQYVWRWDWCQHLMTCGIWRSVELRGYEQLALRDVRLRTRFASDGSATVEAEVEIESFDRAEVEIEVELSGPSGPHLGRLTLDRAAGVRSATVTVEIPEPVLWWPAPLGEPALYECRLVASTPSASDRQDLRYGLRTIELERRDIGAEGESFTFVVNGQPLFCKGSGWNPPEHLFGCVEDAKLRQVIELAAAANMNMLRVNGCATYESDLFYDLCDEHGILVWQDFPFTCGYFPDDDEAFREEIRREADLAIRRLRNRTSLAIWCGSNEVEWMHALAEKDPGNAVGIEAAPRLYGERFYREILPRACARLDPDRPYLPSTPWSAEGFPNSDRSGCRHTWEYEFERPPADRRILGDIELDRSKFVSEFGFLGPSELPTLRRFLPEGELELGSPSWAFHDNAAQEGVTDAVIDRHWAPPGDLELPDYLALGQLFQAEALAAAARHWRRRMFRTSGAITWGYLDCWGTSTSWSLVDYYQRLRAAYFHTARAFEPLHVSLQRGPDGFRVWVVNDRLEAAEATLELGFVDLAESRWDSRSARLTAPAGAAAMVAELELPYEVRAYPERFVAYARVRRGEEIVSRARESLVGFEFSRLRLPPPRVSVVRDGEAIELSAESYVFQLHLSAEEPTNPSDNWFDLLPGETRTVSLPGSAAEEVACWAFAAGRTTPGRVRIA